MQHWLVTGQFERPKNQRGEDGILIIADLVYAVFDGVSSGVDPKAPTPLIDGLTPGQFARENGKRALIEAIENYIDPETLVQYLTRLLREACDRARQEVGDIGRPGYTVVIFLPKQGIIIQIGDCAALIDGVLYSNGMKVDEIKTAQRVAMLNAALEMGVPPEELIKNDPSKILMDQLGKYWQPQYANNHDSDLGFGVVNGTDPIYRVHEIASATDVVMVSDGLFTSKLRKSLIETLQGMEKLAIDDPLCIRECPGVRGFQYNGNWPDDAAGLWLKLV